MKVVVHAGGWVHVREFEHDRSKIMVICIDQCFLGETLEVVISADACVDWDELLVEGGGELVPVGSIGLPVDALVIGSPP